MIIMNNYLCHYWQRYLSLCQLLVATLIIVIIAIITIIIIILLVLILLLSSYPNAYLYMYKKQSV